MPDLCDVEVVAALRRLVLSGILDPDRAAEALDDYAALPLSRHGHVPLPRRILELRDNLSPYDAVYVVPAEVLGAGLLTADDRLGRAVKTHTDVRLLGEG